MAHKHEIAIKEMLRTLYYEKLSPRARESFEKAVAILFGDENGRVKILVDYDTRVVWVDKYGIHLASATDDSQNG